jgi:LIVCS family branched-chain amino acid:cation transporter
MFGIVIITNLRSHGIHSPQAVTRYCIAAAIIAAIGLSLVYIALFNIGATSQALAPNAINGGQTLLAFVEFQFHQLVNFADNLGAGSQRRASARRINIIAMG